MERSTIILIIVIVASILILGLIAYISFCLYISNMMANLMVKPKHFKTKEEKLKELEEVQPDGINEYSRTPINFVMSDGYIIHGDYSMNNPKKFVICMHGHLGNREGSPKYSYAFYRLGYSLVFFDHRGHGENERTVVTMGYQESIDALEVIKQVKEKFGQDIEIGLFGCSMGGATALMCAKDRQDLSFVVSDCGFAGLKYLVKGFIKLHKSPEFPILQMTEGFIKKKAGVTYKKASAEMAIKENKNVPILLIHGDKDELVYPENANLIFNSAPCIKRLEWFKDATHCNSIIVDREKYYKVIEEFIKENVK